MDSIKSLPRQIQKIIEDNAPRALKIYSDWKAKEASLSALRNHLTARTVPRSVMLKTSLIFPECLKHDAADIDENNAAEARFRELVDSFQAAATREMVVIAERATAKLGQALQKLLVDVDKEIIEFQLRLLQVLYPDQAILFQTAMGNYPREVESDLPVVAECKRFIAAWRQYYQAMLTTKVAKDVEAAMIKDKKAAAKQAAEEVIMDDQNNELIRDLIRREMKPIRESIQRLNSAPAERGTSAGKQRISKKPSKVSCAKPRNEQVEDKGERKGRSKSPRKEERKNVRKKSQSASPSRRRDRK